MQEYVNNNYGQGTTEQREIFDQVIAAEREVRNNRNTSDHPNVYFIDACAGSGKSWTINLILASVRAEGGIALATATSGIAALPLPGERSEKISYPPSTFLLVYTQKISDGWTGVYQKLHCTLG